MQEMLCGKVSREVTGRELEGLEARADTAHSSQLGGGGDPEQCKPVSWGRAGGAGVGAGHRGCLTRRTGSGRLELGESNRAASGPF